MTDSQTRERIERLVRTGVERHRLWPEGATVIAAVSGGADSLCLLGTLLALSHHRSRLAPSAIVVAHLEHGLRGAQGAADAQWVAALSQRLGLVCLVERIDTRALARDEHRSIEDAARRARYAFLRRVARDCGAACICTGHTRDDQAETLVMNWLRGAGLSGLSGMAPLEHDVARPLLGLGHTDAVAYCAARGWEPRVDETNADVSFRRNRVRHQLLPLLETYNPDLRHTLTRNAELMAADARFLEDQCDGVWPQVLIAESDERLVLDLPTFQTLAPALRHRVVRRAAHRLGCREDGPEARHLLAVDRLIVRHQAGATLHLPGRLRLRFEYNTVVFERAPVGASTPSAHVTPPAPPRDAQRLPVPGELVLPTLGWRLRAWPVSQPPGLEGEQMHPAPDLPPLAGVGRDAELSRAETRVYVDADVTGDTLWARTWRPGDRFCPLGMSHEKKVQDFFVDAKVPRALRSRLPLVISRDHIVWIAGVRIDNRTRITSATRRVVALQLEPLADQALEGDKGGQH